MRSAAAEALGTPLLQASVTARSSPGQWLSEVVATFGLVFLVLSLERKTAWAAPFAVGSYIAAAYWFTASTSFANPAVTLARGFTATFAGIGVANVPAFVVSQLDRKSTRLNSSHDQISYAVFCLKKKKQTSIIHVRYGQLY